MEAVPIMGMLCMHTTTTTEQTFVLGHLSRLPLDSGIIGGFYPGSNG